MQTNVYHKFICYAFCDKFCGKSSTFYAFPPPMKISFIPLTPALGLQPWVGVNLCPWTTPSLWQVKEVPHSCPGYVFHLYHRAVGL